MGFLGWLLMVCLAYLVYAVSGIVYCSVKVRKKSSESGKLWLEKSSWLYKYCYGPFDYLIFFEAPSKISTCSLGARFLLMPVLYAFMILSVIALALAVTVLFVSGFLFAARPAKDRVESDTFIFVNYKHWPRWRGRRIWPISVIGALAVLFLLGVFICAIPLISATAWWILGVAALSVFSVIIASVLFTVYSRSDNWKAVKQGLKDWRDGVCREVELVEKD